MYNFSTYMWTTIMMLIYLQVLLNTSIRMVMVVEMDLMELSQLASISRVQQQQIMQDTWWWCSRENLVRNCVHMMCEEWISELMRLFSEWADTLKSSSGTSWKKLSRLNTLRLLIRATGAEASESILLKLGVLLLMSSDKLLLFLSPFVNLKKHNQN